MQIDTIVVDHKDLIGVISPLNLKLENNHCKHQRIFHIETFSLDGVINYSSFQCINCSNIEYYTESPGKGGVKYKQITKEEYDDCKRRL